VKKGSLANDKTWFGRRLCCLVLDANLHNLPCICIKIYQNGSDGYFFHFLVIVGFKGEKRKLST